jgi:small subunit ribosomal protein S2
MQNIDKMAADGTFERINKKERLMLDREKAKLARMLGGIEDMSKLPGAILMIDVKREHIAVAESHRLGIPSFGLVDTNSDPTIVDYAIPGNDDASKSINLIISLKECRSAVAKSLRKMLLKTKRLLLLRPDLNFSL